MSEFLKEIYLLAKGALEKWNTRTITSQPNISITRRNVTQVTLILDNELGKEVEKSAQAMKISESDLFTILLKLSKVIRENGLYGNPSVSGHKLGFIDERGNDFIRINIDCPVEGKKQIIVQRVPHKLTN